MPNILKAKTVITLIGMVKLSGDIITLYPYNKKELRIILFINFNTFFSIASPI